MTSFITMRREDFELCLASLNTSQPVTIWGYGEDGIKSFSGIVCGVTVIVGTEPQCWRITIDERAPPDPDNR